MGRLLGRSKPGARFAKVNSDVFSSAGRHSSSASLALARAVRVPLSRREPAELHGAHGVDFRWAMGEPTMIGWNEGLFPLLPLARHIRNIFKCGPPMNMRY